MHDLEKKFDGSKWFSISTIDCINNFSVQKLIEDVLKFIGQEKYALNINI